MNMKKFKIKAKAIQTGAVTVLQSCCGAAAIMLLSTSAFAVDGLTTLNTILDTLTKFVTYAGGLLCVWGAVVLGSSLNDHNGPGIMQGVWRMVGGAIIIAAALLFKSVTSG